MGGAVQQPVAQFVLLGAGGLRLGRQETWRGAGKKCGRGNHAFSSFLRRLKRIAKAHCGRQRGSGVKSKPLKCNGLLRNREVPQEAVRQRWFMGTLPWGAPGRGGLGSPPPASFGPLKYRLTAGCESSGGYARPRSQCPMALRSATAPHRAARVVSCARPGRTAGPTRTTH